MFGDLNVFTIFTIYLRRIYITQHINAFIPSGQSTWLYLSLMKN